MAEPVGMRLGDYELIERIGGGGMAEVYRAKQLTAFGREVALKLIRSDLSASGEFRARFLREARAISKLSHPNILPLIEFGEENETLYLVMPLIREGTLRDLLKSRSGPLPLEESLSLFIQLCNAVQYAHENGIIHRDLKPQNILLQQHTHVLLTDFGIARDRSGTGKEITSVGIGLGTADYMAPEQAIGQADARSDIYSLGIVLYQLLTGLLPYQGTTPLELIVKHSNDPPPNPRALNPALPPQIVAVMETVLAKNPGERFQTASALSRAVQHALSDIVSLPRSSILGQPLGAEHRSARLSTQQMPPVSPYGSGYVTRPASGPEPGPHRSQPTPGSGYPAPANSNTPPRSQSGWPSSGAGWQPGIAERPPIAPPGPAGGQVGKKRLGLLVLLALLILGVLLSSGLVALGFQGKGPFAALGKNSGPLVTATPSALPGFKLYTNTDHTFNIVYPTSWQKSASSSGVGVTFAGPADNASFLATNDGGNQGDPVTTDGIFCTIFSASPGSPRDVTIGGRRWTQETCDSIVGDLHAIVESIIYKGNTYLITYTASKSSFGNENTRFFSTMERSFAFLV